MKLKKILLSFLTFCLFITSSFLIFPNDIFAEEPTEACVSTTHVVRNENITKLEDIQKFINPVLTQNLIQFLNVHENELDDNIYIDYSYQSSIHVYFDVVFYKAQNGLFFFDFGKSYLINKDGYDLYAPSVKKDAIPMNTQFNINLPSKIKYALNNYGDSFEMRCYTYEGVNFNALTVLYYFAGAQPPPIDPPDPVYPPFNSSDYYCVYYYMYDNSGYTTYSKKDMEWYLNNAMGGQTGGGGAGRTINDDFENSLRSNVPSGGGGATHGGGVGRYPPASAPNSPYPDNSNSIAFGNSNGTLIKKCFDKDSSTWVPSGDVGYTITDNTTNITNNITFAPSGSSSNNDNIVNEEIPIVNATSVSLSSNALNINVGSSKSVNAYVYPNTTSDKRVTWFSSNPSVATVNDGIIDAVMEGTSNITVSTSNGKSATLKVTVHPTDTVIEGGTDPDTGSSIWDFLKSIIDAIGGFIPAIVNGFSSLGSSLLNGITALFKPLLDGLNRIIDWLLNLLDNVLAALPGLLIPSADFMSNLKDIELPKLADNFGFLYQPIQVINDSLTQLSNMSSGDGVISYGAMNDPFYGVEIIPAGSLDLSSMINTPGISQLYQIYKLFINASFLLMFINFAYKKFISLLGGN